MSPTLARRMRRAGLAVLAALSVAAPSPAASTTAPPAQASTRRSDPGRPVPVKRACGSTVPPGQATCLALVRTDITPHRGIQRQIPPAGLGATDLQRAYRLPVSSAGKGQTIAIVDVFDNPNAESDLAVYRAQYGLPPCTSANGCFKKVNEQGGARLPQPDIGWAEEESLDLDMASAACPNCHILLVEASQPTLANLGTGVNTAVRLGARYISNSYGGREDPSGLAADHSYFDHPGIAITAASGDSGYGVLYPSASQYVTAVGGTSLSRAANARGWNDTAWSNGGSGCSGYRAKPAWQKDTGCPQRTVADVSAVADPRTGVAVYDSYGVGGWLLVGGTSAAAPIIAGAYALAGQPASGGYAAAIPYAHATALNDVVSGSNGTCSPAYLCTAGPGYDGPTGLGTPNGVDAFRSVTPALAETGSLAAPAAQRVTASPNGPAPSASPAGGGGTVTNGGFETGDLSGWSASGVVTGVTASGAHGGKYAALLGYLDDPKKGDSTIKQTFTAAKGHQKLSFWYNVSCPDRETYDWATAELTDQTTGTTRTVLPKTCTYDDTWQQVTAPIIGGHSYVLTLSSHDDGYFGDPTATRYDDVTIS